MAHTTPLTATRVPDSSDSPNLSTYFSNMAVDLEKNAIPRFGSTASRDTAFSNWVAAGNSMVDGLKCFVTGTGEQTYLGGAWRTGWLDNNSWTSFGVNSPLSVGATFGCWYRVRNGWCHLTFEAAFSGGGTYSAGFVIASGLPAPSSHSVLGNAFCTDGTAGSVYVNTSGQLINFVAKGPISDMWGSVTYPVG